MYPLKFTPIFKDYLWGGTKLKEVLGKDVTTPTAAESWELSGVDGNVSIVAEGTLKGKSLQDLLEVYGEDLLGKQVFERFGPKFPILIKFIDAEKDLSVQLHPGDELAKARHNSFGKTEMWHVMQAEKDAELIVGFNKSLTREEYVKAMEEGKLLSILNRQKVASGDTFFISPGKVHAIGAGILLAEIQQTSNVTYRIYDYDRKDKDGNTRELHTDLALDALDYDLRNDFHMQYATDENRLNPMVKSPYFITDYLHLTDRVDIDVEQRDSFHIYICTEGESVFTVNGKDHTLHMGETLLMPACIDKYSIRSEHAKILEVHL
ncbi:type I phosphomannose isomerase catalytic subunit [Robertkochia sediminum]|uniref:type I phosphomannose isomerase catalytic subunit n=1 Tax=Robertkochia sediminum TaxID=2785326 RepID=UPI001931A06F|nr:type I phosphomannose isomerase catalytic subunit [Robertkochia sediminum]MBL7472751.1 class I mannose-6-phosphate isomerase [Robertkochia sediminum]